MNGYVEGPDWSVLTERSSHVVFVAGGTPPSINAAWAAGATRVMVTAGDEVRQSRKR